MAYAYKNERDSDVHLYRHIDGYLKCHDCPLPDVPVSYVTRYAWDFLAHIIEHDRAGHKVPNMVYKRFLGGINAGKVEMHY